MLPWTPPELANLLNALAHKGEALFYDQENQRYVLTATTRALEEEMPPDPQVLSSAKPPEARSLQGGAPAQAAAPDGGAPL